MLLQESFLSSKHTKIPFSGKSACKKMVAIVASKSTNTKGHLFKQSLTWAAAWDNHWTFKSVYKCFILSRKIVFQSGMQAFLLPSAVDNV